MHDGCHPPAPPGPADAARRWRAALPRQWRRSSLRHGLLVVAVSGLLYLGAFLGAFLLPHPLLRLGCILVLPVLIGSLFVIGHDAAHNSLTPLGWLNRVLGRLVMLPAYHPYTSWSHAHNTLHHGWTNFKGRHPDFPPFTKEEFDALPAWRRWLERFYRLPVGIGPFYMIDFYFRYLLFPSARRCSPFVRWFQLDRALVLAFLLGQLGLSWVLAGLMEGAILPRPVYTVVAVVVPWVVWIWFMGFMSFIQHTHPRMAWYNDEQEWTFYHVQLKSTAHVVFPWPIERLLNNIMDHPAHHLDPQIPLYNLPQSQKLLEETTPEHAVVVRWTPWEYLRTCAACKLYDFRRHCWTDFEGRPTTPSNLPQIRYSSVEIDQQKKPVGALPD
jgi:omega-6 fatty acid desaturase (delta-12 desaturase)